MSTRKSEKWVEKTHSHTNKSGSDFAVGAGLILGVGVSYVASPLIGIPVAASLCFLAWKQESELGECEDVVISEGLIAPFLNRSDLFAYEREFGEEKALDEIKTAIDRKLRISGSAWDFYRVKTTRERIPDDQTPDQTLDQAPLDQTLDQIPLDQTPVGYVDRPESIEYQSTDNPFDNLLSSQLVIFVGSQGSGKSTRLAKLIELHISRGDFVLLLNPFSKASQWQGLAVAGRDANDPFQDVETALIWFSQIIEGRSRRQRIDETYDPLNEVHVSIILEEMTDWASNISEKTLRTFWEKSLRTLRQLNLSVYIATHAITLSGLGGKAAAGYKDAILHQAEIFRLSSKSNPHPLPGESPKIPAADCKYKPANETEYREIQVPENFKPENLNFDFRSITKLEKFPNWKKLVGIA